MKKIKLTTREKVIIGVSLVAVTIIAVKLKNEVFVANRHYNSLANKLCSGGAWKATDITKTRFKLVPAMECCGHCKGV